MNVKRLKQQLALLLVFLLLLGNSAISIAQSLEVAPETDAPVETPAEDADLTEPADEPASEEGEEELPPLEEPVVEEEDSSQEVAEPEAEPADEPIDEEPIEEEPIEEELIDEETNDEEPIEETIDEEPVEDDLEITLPDANQFIEIVSVRFLKTWVDIPEGKFPTIKVQVYDKADPDKTSYVREIELTYNGDEYSSYEWKDLPYRNDDGGVINYGVREILPTGIIQIAADEHDSYITPGSVIRVSPNNNDYWTINQPHFIVTRPNPSTNELLVWTLNSIDEKDRLTFINNLIAAAGGLGGNPPLSELVEAHNNDQIIWLHGPIIDYDVFPEDNTRGEITINVTFKEDGTIDTSVITFQQPSTWTHFVHGEYSSKLFTFTNTYYTASRKWVPMVTKVLQGRVLNEGEFVFVLKRDGDVIGRASNAADGTVTFGTIIFDQEDIDKEYKYTIEEVIPDPDSALGGVTYDNNVIEVTVKVTDKGDGELDITVEYTRNATFTNQYNATAVWAPKVLKELEGRLIKSGEFEFEMTRDDDPTYKQLKQNDADGTVTFDDIEFSLEDVDKPITFSIKEVIPAEANNGITYDTNIYTVKVTASDNEDGTLNLEFEYPDGVDEITFVNVYNATGSWTPKAAKNLVGRDLKDGEFAFELYRVIMDEFGNRYPTLIDTATNNDKGEVVFKEITYNLTDASRMYHYYEIKEKEGTLPGVTYDPKVVRITNMLNDLGDGTIEVKTNLSGELVFNNKYVATGKWDPMVSKTLTGRDLAAGEFGFVLKQDGKVLQTKTNAVDGKVIFDAIEFNLPGTYEYEFSEIKGDAFGVTYDETIHKITVVTTDNGDGTLKVTPSYDSDGVVFKNTFQLPKIDVTATKKWVGGPKEKPVIQLQLYRDGKAFGNVVELDGVTSYTWKDLDKTDVTGKDYKYTVKETAVPNYYEATYSDDGLTVTNTWTKKELPETGMGSNLPLLIGGLSLVMGAGFVMRRRKDQ